MMKPVLRLDGGSANPVDGRVVVEPKKALWNIGMTSVALVLGPLTATVSSICLFIILTYTGLLFGHSIGMHRFLIHRTFDGPVWLERLLVYFGVLVGMAGPFGVIKIHDTRDWAQRRPNCHDFFSHRRNYLQDVIWQLTCRFQFDKPPTITIESKFSDDAWYRWMERSW